MLMFLISTVISMKQSATGVNKKIILKHVSLGVCVFNSVIILLLCQIAIQVALEIRFIDLGMS